MAKVTFEELSFDALTWRLKTIIKLFKINTFYCNYYYSNVLAKLVRLG